MSLPAELKSKDALRVGYPPLAFHQYLWFGLRPDVLADGADGLVTQSQIDLGGLGIQQRALPVTELVEGIRSGSLDVATIPAEYMPELADTCRFLGVGMRVGDWHGPTLIGHRPRSIAGVTNSTVIVPHSLEGGAAEYVLSLLLQTTDWRRRYVPAGKVIGEVAATPDGVGLVDGVEQLICEDFGLTTAIDLGAWWKRAHAAPLPLEVVHVSKQLGEDGARQIARWLEASMDYADEHRDEVISTLAPSNSDAMARYIAMYWNLYCQLCDDTCEHGMRALLDNAAILGQPMGPAHIEWLVPD